MSPSPRTAEYWIKSRASNRYLHADGEDDRLVSTRYQYSDEFNMFELSRQPDGNYVLMSVGDDTFVRPDASGRFTSGHTLANASRLVVEREADGAYRLRVADGSNTYVCVRSTDEMLSTRAGDGDAWSRFDLEVPL